jgi:hypothetical protein
MCRPADARWHLRSHHGHQDDQDSTTDDEPYEISSGRRNPKGGRVIKVSVEIRSGTASFRAAVWAQNIDSAVSLAHARYPGGKARVLFPIDGESFFAKGPMLTSGVLLPAVAEKAAG